MENIKITKEEGTRRCNVCLNANYARFGTGKVVDIYEVECGCLCMALCEDCLKTLANKINEVV